MYLLMAGKPQQLFNLGSNSFIPATGLLENWIPNLIAILSFGVTIGKKQMQNLIGQLVRGNLESKKKKKPP